jgi:hypothetical protein
MPGDKEPQPKGMMEIQGISAAARKKDKSNGGPDQQTRFSSTYDLPFQVPTFISTASHQPSGLLHAFMTLPFQIFAFYILPWTVRQVVLCIDELYEVAGRRARSKFDAFPWFRILGGLLLMGVYHVVLIRLTIKSYRGLRRGRGQRGESGG